ncbi:hypothetical protein [Streptomyces ziwulingensis]|uniref:Minor tail protein n=1 Tax=Streptomyces ziwulingensis TaxID=1045501 RepID=A0ABP9D1H8_9ACTN
MPLLTALQDNFNDNIIGPNWGDSYGGVSETGGRARVPLVAGQYAGYQTGRAWTLAGAGIYLKTPTLPAASGGTDVGLHFMITAPVAGTGVGFKINAVTGHLRMQSNVDYFDGAATEVTYDPVAHLWLRLREDGTNVYWDTSPDGSVWTNRRALATPAWVTAAVDTCAVDLFCYRDAGTTDYAEYDNVNTLSDGAVWTGAAALTGQFGLTAGATATAHGGAQLTADASLGAILALSVHAAAALAAEAELSATLPSDTIPEEVAGLAAGRWNLRIEQGATFAQVFDCSVDDPAFTWEGWSARAQIRTDTSANAELLLDLTPYLTVMGGAIRLSIPAAVTQTLTRNGRWDLEMVHGSIVVRLLQGAVPVSLEVTR